MEVSNGNMPPDTLLHPPVGLEEAGRPLLRQRQRQDITVDQDWQDAVRGVLVRGDEVLLWCEGHSFLFCLEIFLVALCQ